MEKRTVTKTKVVSEVYSTETGELITEIDWEHDYVSGFPMITDPYREEVIAICKKIIAKFESDKDGQIQQK